MKSLSLFRIITLFLLSIGLSAQTNEAKDILLKGTVKDYDGSPIKGARIFIDSLKSKAKTDKEGMYNIKITNKAKLITAYSVKHGLIDFEYNGEDRVNFIFPETKEIVSKRKFSEMGYGYSAYEDSGTDYSSYTDIFQLLRTKFPNVQVIGGEIRIVGTGQSLSNGPNPLIKPLFIVNGTQVSNISSISPADIREIEVERVSSSIYGSRGAGGVIKIELK